MKAFIVLPTRFSKAVTSEGVQVFSSWASYSYWKSYLEVFDEICVIARFNNKKDNKEMSVANGKSVSFLELPDFRGPFGTLTKLPHLLRKFWNVSKEEGVFILRIPGIVPSLLWFMLKLRKKPYLVELVGFPEDSLTWKASGSFIIHLIFRPLMVLLTKMQCSQAIAASYVTERALQQGYPSSNAKVSAGISDVQLPDKIFGEYDRWQNTGNFRIIFVGSLERPYKGVDILLKSFALLLRDFPKLELWIIGDGRLRKFYEKQAEKLKISNKVMFFGHIKHERIFEKLFKAHLFVLPSRQEAMPRALIEAMACGLPCIGAKIGGVPELLPENALVPKNDVNALCNKLRVFLSNPKKLREIGENNRRKIIEKFHPSLLSKRRKEFYLSVRKLFEGHG